MGWIDSQKKSLEWSIKFTTKALLTQLGLLAVNIAGIIYNVYMIFGFGHNNVWMGVGLGAFISNTLWTISICAKWWIDLRDDKSQLKFLKEIESKSNLEQDLEDYKKAKEFYETTYKNIMEEYLRAKPEGAQRLNPEVFNPSKFPNCN